MNVKTWGKLALQVLLATSVVSVAGAEKDVRTNYTMDPVVVTAQKTFGSMYSDVSPLGMLGKQTTMETPVSMTTMNNTAFSLFGTPGDELYSGLTIDPAIRESTSSISLRGFYTTTDAMTINGVPGMVADSDLATNFVEEATVIAGPNMVYNGGNTNSRPTSGGSINLTAKKALDEPIRNFTFSYGTANLFTQAIDMGERFGKNKAWGVRINAMHRDGQTSVHGEKKPLKNIYINIDNENEKISSNLLIGYEDNKHFGGQIYWEPNYKGSKVFTLPKATNGGHNILPTWAKTERITKLAIFNHKQKLGENVYAFVNAGVQETKMPIHTKAQWGSAQYPFATEGDLLAGNYSFALQTQAEKVRKSNVGAGLSINHKFGEVNNTLVVGVDTSHQKNWKGKTIKIPAFTGNLYENNNALEPTWKNDESVKESSRVKVSSVSVVDTMHLLDNKLTLLAGVHHHRYTPGDADDYKDSTSATVPTFGVAYKVNDKLMVYGNYAQDFQSGKEVPNNYSHYTNAGKLLDPYKDTSKELGVKYQTESFLHTLALFTVDGPGFDGLKNGEYGQFANRSYKGLTYIVGGQLNSNLDFFGGVSYTREKYTENVNNKGWEGTQAAGIPYWNGSLGAKYHYNEQTDILGRIVYTGSADLVQKENGNRTKEPGYARFDLGVAYKTKIHDNPVEFTAMLYNIFDKTYWITANMGNQIKPGIARFLSLSATMKF